MIRGLFPSETLCIERCSIVRDLGSNRIVNVFLIYKAKSMSSRVFVFIYLFVYRVWYKRNHTCYVLLCTLSSAYISCKMKHQYFDFKVSQVNLFTTVVHYMTRQLMFRLIRNCLPSPQNIYVPTRKFLFPIKCHLSR